MPIKFDKLIIAIALLCLVLLLIPVSFASDLEQANITGDADSLGSELESGTGNHYYFNASAETDGNGSIESPYKYLDDSKVKKNSVLHFANGVYNFKQWNSKNYVNITIIGEDSQKTIINGTGQATIINTLFNICNITIFNSSIFNQGVMTATNVIFSSSVSFEEGYGNSYGGAIHATGETFSTYIYNCTFINNYGQYGGAIYVNGAILEIYNSRFINNTAYNYGGAIACEPMKNSKVQSKVKIFNSSFVNSTSLNDAGGAIYLKTSCLDAENVNITGSTSTFGGALTLLNTYSQINNLHALNNTAKYDGGAIYHMYGNITVNNSLIEDNLANNGGGMFIDNAYFGAIVNTRFINNTANICGGAIYSLFNDYLLIEDNAYVNNSAQLFNDLYESMEVSLDIGSNNYTMYTVNLTDVSEIPSRYCLIDEGYTTSVKNQLDSGNCWAFAVLGALESAILKSGGENLDLSEEHMKNIIERYSDYGWNLETNRGGYLDMGMGYLISWLGPVLEEDDPFDDKSVLSPMLDSILHVQNILYLKRDNYTDNDAFKKAIMQYGGLVTTGYYAYTYQYTTVTDIDHAIVIVGWDDSISFSGAPGKGGWIVKNSWGPNWGLSKYRGYYYVSYYDMSFAAPGRDISAYAFILNNTIKYDKNYQYDIPGITDYFLNGTDSVWYKNVFNASDDEYLAAVSTHFEKYASYDLSVYVNGALMHTQSDTSPEGYFTIDLTRIIPLKKGDEFEVVFKVTQDGGATFPISEVVSLNNQFYREGVSYCSYDGINWQDLVDLEHAYRIPGVTSHTYASQVACIKAFTVLNIINTTLNLSVIYDGSNPVTLRAVVLNQWGNPVNNGSVLFDIEGAVTPVILTNGVAQLSTNLAEGTNAVQATFSASGYNPSADSASVAVSKIFKEINISVASHGAGANINVLLPDNLNETVLIYVNDTQYIVKANNGVASLSLDNMAIGEYNAEASIKSERYYSDVKSASFSVTYIKTYLLTNDLVAYYKNGVFVATLVDENNNVLAGKSIKFTINGATYFKKTNATGQASISIGLAPDTYSITSTFKGDELFSPYSVNNSITIRTTIELPSNVKYTYNGKYAPVMLAGDGSALANQNIAVTIASTNYQISTDGDGKLNYKVNLKPGTYKVKITNPATGEVKTQTITVQARISENKDLTMYFGAGKSYKVKVLDGNARTVASGVSVVFKVNGKSYKVSTDKNGYASLAINLQPGTYTISAENNGYKVSNKITVKPTIVTGNAAFKRYSTIKFTAKLLDSSGKLIKNKKITFKLNGKTYSAKTNSKGIATVYIKNSLKVGKYTITSAYGKASVKNTITIKK